MDASLKVIVDHMEPYLVIREVNSTVEVTGYVGELWNIIQSKLQLKCEYVISNFINGKDSISNSSRDVLLIPVIVTDTDVDAFDFSVPVVRSWYELYIRREGSDATSVSYLETWSPCIWALYLLTIILLSIVLWFLLRIRKIHNLDKAMIDFEPSGKLDLTVTSKYDQWCEIIRKYNSRNNPSATNLLEKENDGNMDLCTCFFIILASIANQGFLINTKSISMRLVMAVTLIFGLVMFNSYSAVLVSRLAVGKARILFPNLQSVVERGGTHTICVREQSYAYLLFKDNENDTMLNPYWGRVVNRPPCRNLTKIEEIASALCKANTVILELPNVIATILETYRDCTVTRMPGRYATAYASLLMKKNFIHKNRINDIIQSLTSSGIIDYLQKKWLSNQLPQSLPISNDEPVTMSHIKGVLMVYAIAMLLSFVAFSIEIYVHKYRSIRSKLKVHRRWPFH